MDKKYFRVMDKESARKEVDQLTKELNRHNHLYYVESSPEISDYDFDMLLNKIAGAGREVSRIRFGSFSD